MAVYKKSQLALIAVVILLLLAGLVGALRPDLVVLARLGDGVAAVVGLISGKGVPTATRGAKPAGEPAPIKDIYRLDLKTGGRVYTDNLSKSDGSFTYTTPSGLVVTIPAHEVAALRQFKEGEEPQD